MRYHDLPIGDESPEIVNAVIETPQGSANRYVYNAALDSFVLDRVFATPLCYPTFPGCVIRARSIGALHLRDDTCDDRKIVAVAGADPRFRQAARLEDLPEHYLREIHNFFTVCQQLEYEDTDIISWLGSESAHEIIREAVELRRSSVSFQQ